MTKFDQIIQDTQSKHKRFKVVPKASSRLMRIFGYLMFWNKQWLTRYTTTVGFTVYMPSDLIGTDSGYRILRHEVVHVNDMVRWLYVPFFLLYLLLPLPVLLTGRSYFEYRGYVESMRVNYEEDGVISDDQIELIVNEFVGSAYLYMLPSRSLVRWLFKRTRDRIVKG